MPSLKRVFVRSMVFGLFTVTVISTIAIYRNNCCTNEIDQQLLSDSHARSVQWLIDHKDLISNDHNPILWGMLGKTANLTKHPELLAIYQQYKTRYRRSYEVSPLGYMLNGYNKIDFPHADLTTYPYYNLLFMYGFSCDTFLSELASVKQQRQVDFCQNEKALAPACKTHQLMGFMYLQETNCEDPQFIQNTINTLTDEIAKQLFYDPRLIDVYIQRLMLLYESGNQTKVNPRWMERIISAQNSDGGWDNFHPIIRLGENRAVGVGAKSIEFKTLKSDFHASIQGSYLTAMALSHTNGQ